MTAAIYVRLSQNREDDTRKPQRQVDACAAFLQARGVREWTVFTDDDRSAYRAKRRPAWDQLLTEIYAGRIDRVVALHVDRLLRSMSQMETLVNMVEATGCLVHTVESGELDLTTSAGRQVARMMAVIATGESERKSERHRSKAAQLRSEGRSTGGPRPFGWSSPDGELNPSEAQLVHDATASILSGGTLYGIRRLWTQLSVTTTFGRPWTSNKQVARILMRWRNAGLIEHNDEPVGQAGWPAIVTPEDVAAVRSILRDPARRTTPGPSPKWLLSGIARCQRCRSPMHLGLSSAGGKSYRCSSETCYLAVPAVAADKAVIDWVGGYLAEDWHALKQVDRAQARVRQLREELARVSADERTLSDADASMQFKVLEAGKLQKTRRSLEDELLTVSAQSGLAVLLAELKSRTELGLPTRGPSLPDFGLPMAAVELNARAVSDKFGSLSLEQQRTVIRSLAEVQVKPGVENGRRLPPSARVNISPRAEQAEGS